MKRPKRLFFQLFGLALALGAITLGYYQIRWIRTSLQVERQRILNEIHHSGERALDETFDEVRALISFSYLSPQHIEEENWKQVADSLAIWKEESDFPDLLRNVFIIPAAAGIPYLAFDEASRGFIEIEPPADLVHYQEYLGAGSVLDAYRRTYLSLLSKGYFIFPLFYRNPGTPGAGIDSPYSTYAFLAIEVDSELLFSGVLDKALKEHLQDYSYRIIVRKSVLASTLSESELSRPPDMIIPVFGGVLLENGMPPPAEDDFDLDGAADEAMENPVSRFWFLRASGFPNIDPQHFSPQEIRTNIPMLEIYHPDRSLESAMRRRMISSLLLSIGTLILLLSAYFVLYVLLARTEGLRNRERDFVTSMSHELRTPLSVISATSDNLVRGIVDDPGKVKKYGTIIQAQSHRLGKMVESILLYSGIQSRNDVSIRSEEIHLESFFGEIVQNLLPAAEDKGAGILFSKDTQIATVQSDPEALRIISENLIVNALRHGIADTGAKSAQVRVQLRTRPPRLLYIIVEDDGPGIAQQEMKRIFEPFVRGERSKAQQIPGSGLGLHIVRKVVDQLGGQVGVESPYQDMAGISKPGVRFTVRIPVRMA